MTVHGASPRQGTANELKELQPATAHVTADMILHKLLVLSSKAPSDETMRHLRTKLAESQLQQYWEEGQRLCEDSLLCWHHNRRRFSMLPPLARKHLPINTTSAASETLFHIKASSVVRVKHACLHPENANRLVFLARNRASFNDVFLCCISGS